MSPIQAFGIVSPIRLSENVQHSMGNLQPFPFHFPSFLAHHPAYSPVSTAEQQSFSPEDGTPEQQQQISKFLL